MGTLKLQFSDYLYNCQLVSDIPDNVFAQADKLFLQLIVYAIYVVTFHAGGHEGTVGVFDDRADEGFAGVGVFFGELFVAFYTVVTFGAGGRLGGDLVVTIDEIGTDDDAYVVDLEALAGVDAADLTDGVGAYDPQAAIGGNSIRPFNYRGDIGKLMENAVYLHLLRNGYKVYVGKSGDKEIDFMAEKDGERIYVQVAYLLGEDAIIRREFGNLAGIPDNYLKYVVTMDEIQPRNTFKGRSVTTSRLASEP